MGPMEQIEKQPHPTTVKKTFDVRIRGVAYEPRCVPLLTVGLASSNFNHLPRCGAHIRFII